MKIKKKTGRVSMWYQNGKPRSLIDGPRIRLIYPDGKIEWANLSIFVGRDNNYQLFTCAPCYLPEWKSRVTKKEAENIMHKWDKKMRFKRAEFLGWL